MNRDEMFFGVNEVSESLNAINMLKEFLVKSEEDEYYLKWAIIAAHNALQGFMVLALKGTSSLQVIKWKEKYNEMTQYEILSDPDKKIDDFSELYKKIKNKKYMQDNIFVDKSGEVTCSIKGLNVIRNQFIHYYPCLWSISVHMIYNVLVDVLKVVVFLTEKCSEVKRNYNEQALCKIAEVIEECNLLLNKDKN